MLQWTSPSCLWCKTTVLLVIYQYIYIHCIMYMYIYGDENIVEAYSYFPHPLPLLCNCHQYLIYTYAVNSMASWANYPFQTLVLKSHSNCLFVSCSLSLCVRLSLCVYACVFLILWTSKYTVLCTFIFLSAVIFGFCEELPKVLSV